MSDNEIINHLKECEQCHYYNECEKVTRLALDLINRQNAEIERLKTESIKQQLKEMTGEQE